VLTEERILSAVDHPFVANLYGTIQTDTHLHFLMVRAPDRLSRFWLAIASPLAERVSVPRSKLFPTQPSPCFQQRQHVSRRLGVWSARIVPQV